MSKRKKITKAILCAIFVLKGFSTVAADTAESRYHILFDAYGKATLSAHLYGKNEQLELAPGYRADFMIYTDFISYDDFTFNLLSGATTCIARLPETPIKMDRIKYVLIPAIRLPLRTLVINMQLLHECIHTISREETSGSTWWNSIQIGGGTKGAYHYYLIEKYNRRDFSLRNAFDASYTLGYYLHGRAPLIGSNHCYRFDGSGLIRYHLGLFRNQTTFIDLSPHFWVDRNGTITLKFAYEINWVILARENIATLFVNHCVFDENPFDNEESLVSLGFKVIF